MKIFVTCYSGYRLDEWPRSFTIGKTEHAVLQVLDTWYGPDYRYFKVLDEEHDVYILRHDEENYSWELHYYNRHSR